MVVKNLQQVLNSSNSTTVSTLTFALMNLQPDVLHIVPPLVQFCAYNPVVKPHHLESLEFVFIGAAPVGEVLASKFKEKAPNCQFREGK